jgi:ABC-type amino acid transport substrate-binding protein
MKKLMFAAIAAVSLCGCAPKDNSFKMITEATFPPYEFLRGQEVVGLDVELCKAIAAKLGKEFKVESVDFDSVIPALISGKADIAAAGITITEDRKKNVDFSIPYEKTGIVIVYKKSAPYLTGESLKGKRVGVQSGTTSETYVVEELKQEPERMRSPAEACAALEAGRVDAVIADIEPAKNCVKGEDDLAMTDFITSEEYAVAIQKGQPELLAAINEVITELKANGKLAAWKAQFVEESDKLKEAK